MGMRTESNPSRLTMLLAAHEAISQSTHLIESCRPYSVQSRLEELQKLIMEEVKGQTTNDDIPL